MTSLLISAMSMIIILPFTVVSANIDGGDSTTARVTIVPDSTNHLSDTTGNHLQLDRMVVKASKMDRRQFSPARPDQVFSSDDVMAAAGVAEDISRYIATSPSVVSSLGENFDNALYVRGGRPSEVIFVVDGIEMENINHFSQANGSGGPVGFINSEYVKQVDFYAGTTPAAYPSRLSSVVAIDLKNGSFARRSHSVGCKLTGGTFSTEGPIADEKGSYVVAGRYIDFSTLKRFIGDRGIPRLGDVYVKGTLLGNKAAEVSMTGLFSYNTFNLHYPYVETEDISDRTRQNIIEERQRIVQGGCGLTYRMKHGTMAHQADISCSFRKGGTSDSLYYFDDPFFVDRYSQNPLRVDHDARFHAVLSTKSDLMLGDTRYFTFGMRANYHRYRFFTGDYRQYQGSYTFCNDGTAVEAIRMEPPHIRSMDLDGLESSGYGELVLEMGRVTTSFGVRADYYQLLHDGAVSPRLAITFRNDRIGSIRAAGGIQHQFPTEMPSMFFYFFSLFPAMDDDSATGLTRSFLQRLTPLRCYQATIGFERRLFTWMALKSDVYFKWYDREYHFISPKVQEVFYFNNEQGLILREQNGDRKACGIECSINSPKRDGMSYAIGGSFFDVKNRYSDGSWYDDWTNIRYTVSISLGVRIRDQHHFSMGVHGNGGRPFCPEIIIEDCIGRKSSVYESGRKYYSRRLEKLFTTNLRYGFEKQFNRCSTELFVEILNLFNSQPVLDYRFNGESFQDIKPFGIVPIIGGKIVW